MYGLATHCIGKNIIKCSSCLPMSLTYALSLNRRCSIYDVCWMLDQLSFRCRLNSSTSRTEF